MFFFGILFSFSIEEDHIGKPEIPELPRKVGMASDAARTKHHSNVSAARDDPGNFRNVHALRTRYKNRISEIGPSYIIRYADLLMDRPDRCRALSFCLSLQTFLFERCIVQCIS